MFEFFCRGADLSALAERCGGGSWVIRQSNRGSSQNREVEKSCVYRELNPDVVVMKSAEEGV